MKRWAWIVSALAVLLLAAPAPAEEVPGQTKPRKKRRAKAGLRGEYAMMAKVLNLDEETKKKFEEAVTAGKAAIKAWMQGDGAKFKEVSAAYRAARKAKDKDKINELKPQFNALVTARAKLMADNKAAIMALLNDEQKATWAGFVLRRTVMRRYKAAKLTEDQIAQLQKLCEEKAKTIPDATDREKRRERYKALRALYTEVEEKILTAEQREAVKNARPARKRKTAKPKAGQGQDKAKDKPAELGNPKW